MKNLSATILAALSIGTAPLLADVAIHEESSSSFVLEEKQSGKSVISSIRTAYENGKYDRFLKEMDESYHAASETDDLEILGAMRPGISTELQQWEAKGKKLQEEKNLELLAATLGQKVTPFVEKVVSAATNSPSNKTQEEAIGYIASLRQMIPGTGSSNDENLLIAIDLEYEYKALNMDLPNATAAEKREKQCALKMERLACMEQLKQQFHDPELKVLIGAYAEQFDARLAQSWDLADLGALGAGEQKPKDAFEEKVASILSLYQEKFSDLTQQFINEHDQV